MLSRGEEMTFKERKHFLADLGFCIHNWKFIRTEKNEYKTIDVCECEICGKRRGFKVW
jgi:hypothetical protein